MPGAIVLAQRAVDQRPRTMLWRIERRTIGSASVLAALKARDGKALWTCETVSRADGCPTHPGLIRLFADEDQRSLDLVRVAVQSLTEAARVDAVSAPVRLRIVSQRTG